MALINKFPLLDEFELSLCSDLSDQNVFDVIAKSCPKLKHFLHIKRRYESHDWNGMAMSIAGMHGLRSLELHGSPRQPRIDCDRQQLSLTGVAYPS